MAEQMDKEMIRAVKMQYPDYTVVAYINTTAELKTICDVCVTSSSAVKIVSQLSNDKILFIPDCNLGSFVQQQLPEKKIKLKLPRLLLPDPCGTDGKGRASGKGSTPPCVDAGASGVPSGSL